LAQLEFREFKISIAGVQGMRRCSI